MAPLAVQAELVKGDPAAALQGQQAGLLISEEFAPNTSTTSNNTMNSPTEHQTTSSTLKDNHDANHASLEFFDVDSASIWDGLASFSMLFLWIQRSAFGVVAAFQSLIVGHCVRLLLGRVNGNSSSSSHSHSPATKNTIQEDHEKQHSIGGGARKYFYLVQSLLLGTTRVGSASSSQSSSSPHKQVHGAWPPPGLVALAILTVVALIVHPDGMTWIMLRKIRDAMMSILQSSTTCWAIMIRDYGVVGTVSASASITVVLIVAIAMHRAFFPNCCGGGAKNNDATTAKRRNLSAAEKKRRRRKGHSKSNARGRIKTGSPLSCSRLPKVEEVASDGAGDNSSRSSHARAILKDVFEEQVNKGTSKSTVEVGSGPNPDERTSDVTMATSCFEEEAVSIMTSPSALESVVSTEEYEVKGRTPVPSSVCTVDTTSMSDDISCGSFSVRSVPPSRPTNNRSAGTPTSKGKAKSNTGTRGSGKANQRGQKQTKAAHVSKLANPTPMTPMSRAEGLKTAKPVPKFMLSPAADTRYDAPKNNNGAKRASGGKGRKSVPQNARGGRVKGGRIATKPQQKNKAATRTVSPVPTTSDSSFLVSTTPSPRYNPTTVSESPAASSTVRNNNKRNASINRSVNPSNENTNESRLPPFSPYSQSLFSCEIGASAWSLPSLPVVSQQKNVAGATPVPTSHAHSYTSNPFVTPYSQMPSESNGPSSVVVQESNTSLNLWNSSVQARSVPPTSHSNLSTPQRPLRAPPGLPAPPGFAPAQPSLSTNASDLYTPARMAVGNETPCLMPAAPSLGTPSTGQEASLFPWNSTSAVAGGVRANDFSSPAMMKQSTPVVKKNPFEGDTINGAPSDEVEFQIEAELQELGGRMVGSVLDF